MLRAGLEEANMFFGSVNVPVVDIGHISPSFEHATWAWGGAMSSTRVDFLPNGAGQPRVLMMGRVQFVAA
eukprot:9791048-Prorocentrum_lima.AAC.1